jgi:taurine dioxygenase
LTRWIQQPQFTVRHRWSAGTIGMWDNRFSQHYVVNDFVGKRVIERVTVMRD